MKTQHIPRIYAVPGDDGCHDGTGTSLAGMAWAGGFEEKMAGWTMENHRKMVVLMGFNQQNGGFIGIYPLVN